MLSDGNFKKKVKHMYTVHGLHLGTESNPECVFKVPNG